MNETITFCFGAIATVLCVGLICGAFAYGCTTTNKQYYNALSECIQSGGSAVPTNNSAGGGVMCLRTK